MARSAKISLPIQDELESHDQLSLFVARSVEEIVENVPSKLETKPPTRSKKQANYSAADIKVLEGIAAIRHRPGMYIGSTSSSGLLHLLWEALANAVDEAVAGYGNHIWVSLESDGWMTVRDEARGMPFDPMLYQGNYSPAATIIMTVPHSGGKFEELGQP
jgi:DNA gyrase subunit B